MIFDAHMHLVPDFAEPSLRDRQHGLLISRSADENDRYVQVARKLGLRCAVFTAGGMSGLEQILKWIETGEACAYDHGIQFDRFDPGTLHPILETSQRCGRPLVIHLSHHDERSVPPRFVTACLDYLTEEFPELRIVVAHLGGENHNVVLTYAESNPNIFLDISRFSETSKRLRTLSPKDLLRSVRDGVPATNLIFGTDQVGVWNPEVSPEYLATCEVFSEGDCTQVFLSNALALFDDGRERILGQGTKDPD